MIAVKFPTSSVGPNLASKLPSTNREFTDYMSSINLSALINPIVTSEIETEIFFIPLNKAHGFYSCPTRILRSIRHILSKPLADIMNKSFSQSGCTPF